MPAPPTPPHVFSLAPELLDSSRDARQRFCASIAGVPRMPRPERGVFPVAAPFSSRAPRARPSSGVADLHARFRIRHERDGLTHNCTHPELLHRLCLSVSVQFLMEIRHRLGIAGRTLAQQSNFPSSSLRQRDDVMAVAMGAVIDQLSAIRVPGSLLTLSLQPGDGDGARTCRSAVNGAVPYARGVAEGAPCCQRERL